MSPGERSERTRNGYAKDWAVWSAFCAETGLPLSAVTSSSLVRFVEWLWTQPGWTDGTRTAPSTIDRRLAGTVVTARTEHGVTVERNVARDARRRLRQLVEQMEDSAETRGRGPWPW
ncbi:hypothetical protein GCM10010503_47580 [Streptomyces lucensis JCM 4490]|uniref:Integrase n=1 Tax=Streptomyces lucensis JCM 4490 TaxID=1306176 RepID=A0A918J9T1_9ACTN|nr:hypothetical protein [Streptomyces lucensis]GGW64829.1 hypothetical protein GCM10010503_47580 [Streptomyces lucensis JCM 4490]